MKSLNPTPMGALTSTTSGAMVEYTYGHMVNMFMTMRECKPTKETTSYDPGQWFGQQWEEGNFCELLECIPSKFMNSLDNQHDTFTKYVEPSRCCKTVVLITFY